MSSSFDAVKAAIKADLENEQPDTGFHDQWIRSKIRALEKIKSEADLASPEEITRNIGKFDSHIAVSQMIREALTAATACGMPAVASTAATACHNSSSE